MAMSTRERLIETAGDLFYQRGFQAVGLDQILDEVGITKTAFYKHFESKDALIIAVLNTRDEREVREWREYLDRRAAVASPAEQLLAMFDLLDEWFSQKDFRGCLFLNATTEFPSPNDPIHQAASKHGEHLAMDVRARVERAGVMDAEGLTRLLMMLVAGAITDRHSGGKLDAARTARAAAEMLIEGQLPAGYSTPGGVM